MVAKIQINRTLTPNTPPADGALALGELSVELASTPTKLWVGVPTSVDATGRKLLNAATGVTVAETPSATPAQGDLWFESDTGTFWIWYVDPTGGQWVQVNGTPAAVAPTVDAYTKAESDAKFVDVIGDTMTGALTIEYPWSALFLSTPDRTTGKQLIGQSGGLTSWGMFLGDGSSSFVNADDFVLTRHDDTGAAIANAALLISRATGGAWFGSGIVAANNITCNVNWGGLIVNSPDPATGKSISTQANGVPRWTMYLGSGGAPDDFQLSATPDAAADTLRMYMQRASGNFTVYAVASKPGAGDWADSSDARIKTVTGNYSSGLAAVKALNPVTYTFKGNDTPHAPSQFLQGENRDGLPDNPSVPYRNSPHRETALAAKQFVGLVAQDAETPMPEMVTQEAGYIDGQLVNDLRILDTTPLIYALVNAVKELSAEIDALKAQIAGAS